MSNIPTCQLQKNQSFPTSTKKIPNGYNMSRPLNLDLVTLKSIEGKVRELVVVILTNS